MRRRGLKQQRPNLSGAMRRRAEGRRCPKCGRKGAIVSLYPDPFFVSACRFGCGWVRAREITADGPLFGSRQRALKPDRT
jgi:hypothetical protein